MKKIVLINKNLWSFNNFRYQLAKSLSRKYQVYCLYGGSDINPKKNTKNIKFYNIGLSQKPIDILKDLTFILKLIIFIKKIKPKYIHCFNPKPVLLSFFALIFFRQVNFFLTITGLGHSYLTKNKLIKFITNILYFFTFKRSDLIFFQNKEDLAYFKNKNYLKDKKYYVSPGLGVNMPKKIFKKNIGKIIKFGFASRITKEKGIIEFINAIKILKKEKKYYSQCNFYIVENFDKNSIVNINKNILKRLTKNLDINFIKFENNIYKIFKKFDVMIFPSYREGSSKTIMEACSYGKLVACSNVPGCNNLIKNLENGFLFKSKSSIDISKIIKFILNNRNSLSKISYLSRKRALLKFDEKKIIKKIMKFYK